MDRQRRRSRQRWGEGKVSLTAAFYLILSTSFANVHGATNVARNQEDGGETARLSSLQRMNNVSRRLRVTPTTTRSAIRAERQIGIPASHAEEMLTMNESHRMQEQTLLDRFMDLDIREPEFKALLAQEIQEQQALEEKRPSVVSMLAYRCIGNGQARFWSMTTLLLASFATVLWFHPWLSESRLALQSAVNIPLLHVLSSPVSVVAVQPLQALILEVVAIVQLFLTPEMVKFAQETFLPISETFKKMLLMDAWRRFWKIFGWFYKSIVGSQVELSSATFVFDDEAMIELMSPWFRTPLLYLEQVLRRGTKSFVKRSIQGNVNKRIRLAVEGAVKRLIRIGTASTSS